MNGAVWNDRKVLVTGVSGFIGSALAKNLLESGSTVVGLVHDVNNSFMSKDTADKCILSFGDITNYQKMCEVVSSYEVDTIFHLAARAIVRVSSKDPLVTYNTNVMGTVAVLEAARNVGRCTNIVVASSDKAYGDHDVLPYTERHSLQPKNTYDTSKACTDLIARSYAYNYNMPVTVTRCSNVYGPGDRNFSRLIPNSIRLLLSGERPVLFKDVEEMEREFIFIEDVVNAYKILGNASADHIGEAFNIGGAGMVSVGSIVETLSRLMDLSDVKPKIIERDAMFKEILKQCIDSSKLKNLGWDYSYSLEEGLLKTIEWYKNIFI